jgi:hypothetical protein
MNWESIEDIHWKFSANPPTYLKGDPQHLSNFSTCGKYVSRILELHSWGWNNRYFNSDKYGALRIYQPNSINTSCYMNNIDYSAAYLIEATPEVLKSKNKI